MTLDAIPLSYGLTERHRQYPCGECGMTARGNGVMCGPCARMMAESGPIEEPYGSPGRPYRGRAWKRRARAAIELIGPTDRQMASVYPPGTEAVWEQFVAPQIRRFAMDNIRRDYGYADSGWGKARELLAGAPLSGLLRLLRPTVDEVRSAWTTCSECGEFDPAREPLERPEYQEALSLARARAAQATGRPEDDDDTGE